MEGGRSRKQKIVGGRSRKQKAKVHLAIGSCEVYLREKRRGDIRPLET